MMREFVRSHLNRRSYDSNERYVQGHSSGGYGCELSDELGYEKSERTSNDECGRKSKNYRNGYSKKTVKTQMSEPSIKLPRNIVAEPNKLYPKKNTIKSTKRVDKIYIICYSSSVNKFYYSSRLRRVVDLRSIPK